MRINVYSQEITDEINLFEKESNTGLAYSAVQLMLHSSPMLHHRADDDDDRSAVTFWLPKSQARRKGFADTLRRMADAVERAKPETGLD